MCPWIPHEKTFTREDALKAAEVFNRVGKAAREAGLRFGYHCHGYEFVPSPEGTLFDTLAGGTDPVAVELPDRRVPRPARRSRSHGAHREAREPRVLAARQGPEEGPRRSRREARGAEPEADVPVGTGQIDYPAVLRAAVKAGTSLYYVEDESKDPLANIPQSLTYLKGFKP